MKCYYLDIRDTKFIPLIHQYFSTKEPALILAINYITHDIQNYEVMYYEDNKNKPAFVYNLILQEKCEEAIELYNSMLFKNYNIDFCEINMNTIINLSFEKYFNEVMKIEVFK